MDVGAVLSPLNLTHLLPLLDGQDLALERAALLVKLKELGVDKLPERQKIATAIAKALRGPAAPAADTNLLLSLLLLLLIYILL